MAKDLTLRSIDVQALISSPECLAWRRISLGTVKHPGLAVRTYLSGGLTLTDNDRFCIRRKVTEVRAASEADNGPENRKARLTIIGNLLLSYPIPNGTQEAGRARAEAYLIALEGIPPWAIAEVVKGWHRGECGHGYDYRWAPAPAELRQLSVELVRPARKTIAHLEAVLGAVSLERAMDPSPIEPEVTPQSGRVVLMGERRA